MAYFLRSYGWNQLLIHFNRCLDWDFPEHIHCWKIPHDYGNPISWIFIIPNMKGRINYQLIINHQLIITIYIVPVLHIIFHHHHQFYYILLSPVLQFHYYNSIITISVALPYIIQFIFYHLYYPQLVITITYSYINQYKPIEKPIENLYKPK